MKKIMILVLFSMLFSCTNSKPSNEVTSTDSLEFAVDSIEEQKPLEEVTLKTEVQPIEKGKEVEEQVAEVRPEEMKIEMPEEPKFEEFKKTESIVDSRKKEETIPPQLIEETKYQTDEQKYIVQKGDTLMMIGFKIYGDYRKWKDLKSWNQDKLRSKLSAGTELKYHLPEKEFGWAPNGLPYLVKTGDTLGLISMDKYGTSKKWRSIYQNNQPLIRDPNLIFAGFTIYYLPTREIASKAR